MRKAFAVISTFCLLNVTFPLGALAQTRAVIAPAAHSLAVPKSVPSLPSVGVTLPLSSILSPSLTPSLSQLPSAPSINPQSVAVSLFIPQAITPSRPVQTPIIRAHPVLAQAAARLTAASVPETPVSDAKRVSDEVFSGEIPRRSSEEAPVQGRYSSPPSLSPAAPASAPAKKIPLIARWRSAMADGSGPLVVAAFA